MKMNKKEFEEYLNNYMYYILDKLDPVYYGEVMKSFKNFIKNMLIMIIDKNVL